MVDVAYGIFCIVVVVLAVFVVNKTKLGKQRQFDAMSPEARATLNLAKTKAALAQAHGALNPVMICPHCQLRGEVRTKAVVKKKGVGGAKATAAVFTAGISMVATGLSRKGRPDAGMVW
jgi:hypothetical protein